MLVYPNIDPIAITFGSIDIRWYSLTYLMAFFAGKYLIKYQLDHYCKIGRERYQLWDQKRIDDFAFYIFIGVIIGGRLGEMLFYQLDNWLSNPLLLFYVMQGGMSHHGGLIGVILVVFLFARKSSLKLLELCDLVAMPFALAPLFVRIGNFINSELWGKPTEMPWGFLVQWQGTFTVRHPTQLYQALAGVLMLAVLYFLFKRQVKTGVLAYVFLIASGTLRFLIEFFKAPSYDGYILWGWLSRGQILASLVVLVGLVLAYYVHRKMK